MHQNIERFFKTDAMEEWCFGNTHNFPRQANICYYQTFMFMVAEVAIIMK